jgi:hypothetical protein
MQLLAQVAAALLEVRAGNLLDRKKAVALAAVVDEAGFERGFDAGDASFVYVSMSRSISFCPSTMATRSSSRCVALIRMRFIQVSRMYAAARKGTLLGDISRLASHRKAPVGAHARMVEMENRRCGDVREARIPPLTFWAAGGCYNADRSAASSNLQVFRKRFRRNALNRITFPARTHGMS